MQIFLNLSKILPKVQKNKFYAPKSKFQNKTIIQQRNVELEKVLW